MTISGDSAGWGPVAPRTAAKLRRAEGRLSSDALKRMDQEMAWFGVLPAQERALIGMVVQAGIREFVEWYCNPDRPSGVAPAIRTDVFGVAPVTFAGRISLQRTVEMIRLSIDVVEANMVDVLGPDDAPRALAAITRYGREIAFATAEVYARAAEQRGAWDSRLESLLADSVLRGDVDPAARSRASALGWPDEGRHVVIVGPLPASGETTAAERVRRAAHDLGLRALHSVNGDRLVVIAGGALDRGTPKRLLTLFGPGPVVTGPIVDGLAGVPHSADAAFAALSTVGARPGLENPIAADDLLPERALNGDSGAARQLVEEIYVPLRDQTALLETIDGFFAAGASLQGAARALFIHVNTVRYRLRRVAELTARDATTPREGYELQIAITLGRLADL